MWADLRRGVLYPVRRLGTFNSVFFVLEAENLISFNDGAVELTFRSRCEQKVEIPSWTWWMSACHFRDKVHLPKESANWGMA